MTNGNDPVSPQAGRFASDRLRAAGGLTKREYFAAMAMQGLLSVQDLVIHIGNDSTIFKVVSDNSIRYADGLIAALNKEK